MSLAAVITAILVAVVVYLSLISAVAVLTAAHRIAAAHPYCVARVKSGILQSAIFVAGEKVVMGGRGRATIYTDLITAETIFLVATGDNQAHYVLATTAGRIVLFETFPSAYGELEERRWAHLLEG